MRIIRYVCPVRGSATAQEIDFSAKGRPTATIETGNSRLEIYNSHGDLVCILNQRHKLKTLKLQRGFYLLREIDQEGKIIKRDRLVF